MNIFRSKQKSALAVCMTAMLLLAAGASLAAPAVIGASGHPNTYTNLVAPATIAANTFSNLTSQPLKIVSGKSYGVECSFTGSGTTDVGSPYATNVVQITNDGTNWLTVASLIVKLSGTSTVLGYTNIPGTFLESSYAIRVSQVGNGDSNTMTVNYARLTRAKNPL